MADPEFDKHQLANVILYDALGRPFAVQNGVAVPAETPALMVASFDGEAARYLKSNDAGRLDINLESWLGSLFPTVGQKPMAKSVPVTFAEDQTPLSVTFTPVDATTGVSAGTRILGGGTAATLQVMRATPYTEPTAAAQRSVASNSASDTAAGTGARSMRIVYLDDTGAGPFMEVVALSGATPVNTVATNIRFIEQMEVVSVGSGGANVGTITLFGATGGGGGTVGTIGVGNVLTGVGDNTTLWAQHYVPTGKMAQFSVLVMGLESGGSGTNGKFFLRAAFPLIPNAAEERVGDVVLAIAAYTRSFTFNPEVSGFARVTAYLIPGTNNTNATVSFDWSEGA
jgi:hypothetical protein